MTSSTMRPWKSQLKYSLLKEAVSETVVNLTNKYKAKKNELLQDKSKIVELIQDLSAKARFITNQTLYEVKNISGLQNIL